METTAYKLYEIAERYQTSYKEAYEALTHKLSVPFKFTPLGAIYELTSIDLMRLDYILAPKVVKQKADAFSLWIETQKELTGILRTLWN